MYRKFEDIESNKFDICQTILNINNKTRSSIYTWSGQFSPQFVEAILDKYALSDDVVLDPFMGSGTTLVECARKNITVSGIELNPSAFYMSKSFEICNLDYSQRDKFIKLIDGKIINIVNETEIISTLNSIIQNTAEQYIKNTISLLIVLMDLFNAELSIELLNKKWLNLKNIIKTLPYSYSQVKALHCDTRVTKFADDTFSLIITSPPYINVFNYHQKYRKSVEALGYDVLKIAKCEFGSNRKNRGNRLYTVIQYCIDIALAFKEWKMICKDRARFIIVVGRESNVLSMNFSNSKLVYEVACEALGLDFKLKQERVFKNRFGQMIYEDILHFENNKLNMDISEQEIINRSKNIAVRALEEKMLCNISYENIILLKNAIEKSQSIQKSEEFTYG